MILGTITTYNPEIKLLEKNIAAVITQVDRVLIYENDSENRKEILELCKKWGGERIQLILNEKNEGVAGPLHDGAEYAYKNGFDYIFTLDQDTVIPEGYVGKLSVILERDPQNAMVCGTFIDPNVPRDYPREDEVALISDVITSGTLARVSALIEVGNYIPELFIDAVDCEIGWRLRKHGYLIVSCGVRYVHCIGQPQAHKFLFMTVHTLNYSPLRLYYLWRNAYALFRFYKEDDATKELRKYINNIHLKILLIEKEKIKKLKAIRRGKRDAKRFCKQLKEKYAFL